MTAPLEILLDSLESLLKEGRLGAPALFPVDGPIPIYRGDVPVTIDPPHIAICQAGSMKERHKPGSGLWEIPVSARLVLDRNGTIGDTPEEVAESIHTYATDLEAMLTLELLQDSSEPEGDTSTPEQRLSDGTVHVWEISDVTVEADTELEGDPVREITFTAFCTQASRIIP